MGVYKIRPRKICLAHDISVGNPAAQKSPQNLQEVLDGVGFFGELQYSVPVQRKKRATRRKAKKTKKMGNFPPTPSTPTPLRTSQNLMRLNKRPSDFYLHTPREFPRKLNMHDSRIFLQFDSFSELNLCILPLAARYVCQAESQLIVIVKQTSMISILKSLAFSACWFAKILGMMPGPLRDPGSPSSVEHIVVVSLLILVYPDGAICQPLRCKRISPPRISSRCRYAAKTHRGEESCGREESVQSWHTSSESEWGTLILGSRERSELNLRAADWRRLDEGGQDG